jgi:uncharacterized delta-60 repeat protein
MNLNSNADTVPEEWLKLPSKGSTERPPMKTTLSAVAAFSILLVLATGGRAEPALQAWVQRYNGAASYTDVPYAMAVDGCNNVIVAGVTFGSTGAYDYMTIKYSSAGVPLWTNYFGGSAMVSDYAYAVAVDDSNDVIVTGSAIGSGSCEDYVTIKYSSAGVAVWTNRYNGPGNCCDIAYSVAVDRSNDVIVTGTSYQGTCYDYATIKYSRAGLPLWTNRYDGLGNNRDEARAVAVDGSNNIIVTGWSYGTEGVFDYATIKYSSGGVPLWTNRYANPESSGSSSPLALAVDSSNNVIVTGYSTNSASGADYVTIKYSSAGVPLWTNMYNGPGNGPDYAYVVAADHSDNVIVTGLSTAIGNYYDFATIKYSSAGVPLWTNFYNGPANNHDGAYAMAVDCSNNLIVAGYSYLSSTSCCYTILKYSSAGGPIWTNLYNGPRAGWDYARAVAVDHNDNVIVTGQSIGNGGFSDVVTIKYVSNVPPPAIAVLRPANGTCQVRLDDVLQACTVVIEACTNLTCWAPVFTNTTPTNTFLYSDPNAGGARARFYRAYQFPQLP